MDECHAGQSPDQGYRGRQPEFGRQHGGAHPRPPAYGYPVWAEQPEGQTVPGGCGVLFSARAISDGPLSYQWYFNGLPVVSATHRLFFQNAVEKENKGSYWVVASNPSYSITSSTAFLFVTKPISMAGSNPFEPHRLSIAGIDEQGVPVLSLAAYSEGPFTLETSSFYLTNWLPASSLTNTGSPFYFTDPGGPLQVD